jgi:hypothetical protein
MGLKSQYQVGMKQRQKRKKARAKLTAKGEKLENYFYGKYYLKSHP